MYIFICTYYIYHIAGPLGSCGPGPCGPGPCAHPGPVDRPLLAGPLGHCGPGPCGPPGPMWAEPSWAGPLWAPWALVGRAP